MGLYTFFWIVVILGLFIIGSALGEKSKFLLYVCWGIALGFIFRAGFLKIGMYHMLDFIPFEWMNW